MKERKKEGRMEVECTREADKRMAKRGIFLIGIIKSEKLTRSSGRDPESSRPLELFSVAPWCPVPV